MPCSVRRARTDWRGRGANCGRNPERFSMLNARISSGPRRQAELPGPTRYEAAPVVPPAHSRPQEAFARFEVSARKKHSDELMRGPSRPSTNAEGITQYKRSDRYQQAGDYDGAQFAVGTVSNAAKYDALSGPSKQCMPDRRTAISAAWPGSIPRQCSRNRLTIRQCIVRCPSKAEESSPEFAPE